MGLPFLRFGTVEFIIQVCYNVAKLKTAECVRGKCMEKVRINDQIFEYTLKRSARKSIAIEIGYDGRMVVRAPFRVPMEKVEELIENKKDWIYENLTKRISQKPDKGDCVYYLGKKLPLKIVEEKTAHLSVRVEEESMVIRKPVGFALNKEALLEHWYRKMALELITEKVQDYSRIMQVSYQNITIKDQKTRWGSCSSRGNLNFNYRLIMAPLEVLEYVVIHELAHRVHMDHSAAFWDEVACVMPEYGRCRLWLKEHGHELML